MLVLALVLGLAGPVLAGEITVSAAISTKDAMEEIGRGFVRSHPGATLRYNFGSSGALQKQIEAGAPVDVFVSAAERPMDELARQGLIEPATRRTFAGNVLVVVTPRDSQLGLARAAGLLDPRVRRIVIGNPRTVPAGRYAAESLRALGLWDRLQPRLILAENVRQALDYVARGEVDAGFVYATDVATRGPQVREAFRPPAGSHGAITYPAAVVTGARRAALARAFVGWLTGPESQAVLARLGFQPVPAAVR